MKRERKENKNFWHHLHLCINVGTQCPVFVLGDSFLKVFATKDTKSITKETVYNQKMGTCNG